MKKIFLILFCFLTNGIILFCDAQPHMNIDSLKNVYMTAKEDSIKVQALNNLSRVYWTNSPDSSLLFANKAIALAKKIDFKKGIGVAFLNMGVFSRNTGNYQEAIQYVDSAMDIGIATNNNGILGDSYNSLANIYWYQSNYEKALEFYLNAMKIKELIQDTLGIALVNSNIGMIYAIQGNYPLALNYYLKSLKVFESKNDKIGVAKSFNCIAFIYYQQNDYSQAIDYYFKSLALSEPINAIKVMGESYANLGLIYMKQANYSLALENFSKTLAIAEATDDKATIGVCYDNIGIIYKEQGKYNEALKNHFASLKIAQEIGDSLGISGCYSNIGNVYNKKEQYPEAIEYLSKGLHVAQAIGVKVSMKDNYLVLSEVYEKMKDYTNAIKFHKLYSQMKDTLLNEENNKQIAEMKTKYETEKKGKEISLLTKDKEIQSIEIKKQKLEKYSFIGGLGFIIILLLFGYRVYHSRQVLRLQSIRNKISGDLHDDIGSTLNSISIYSEVAKKKNEQQEEALEMIGDASRKIIDTMSDIVWTINPENDSFAKIIFRMKSLAFNLFRAKKIEFTFHADEILNEKKLSIEERRNFYLIFKEAVNNLVKYSNATHVEISLSNENDFIKLQIKDNGIGFDISEHNEGNGLKNMKRRADEMKAQFKINSQKGSGTQMELVLKA